MDISKALPFYHFLTEDQCAHQLIMANKIDLKGHVQWGLDEVSLDERHLQLAPSSVKKIMDLIQKEILVIGRRKGCPLNLNFSIKKLVVHLYKVVQESSTNQLQIHVSGSAVWEYIKENAFKILKVWLSDISIKDNIDTFITPRFKGFLEEAAKEYDFEFRVANKSIPSFVETIDRTVVSPLAKQLKARKINPHIMVYELEKAKVRSQKKPPTSYACKLFAKYPALDAFNPNLHKAYIEAFAFNVAADVADKVTRTYFSLRSLRDATTAYDCVFIAQARITTTPINSLRIPLAQLFGPHSNRTLQIESVLGEDKVVQAISDRNLLLLTCDASKPADFTELARTLWLFTKGGRCWDQKWIDLIDQAFSKELKHKRQSLSEMLSLQLINQCGHESQALIALTFNASALILWRHPALKAEVQKLWMRIFGHIDIVERPIDFAGVENDPFIESIIMLMRDPDFEFADLYAQMQVSAILQQHSVFCDPNHPCFKTQRYPCFATQTFGEIFTNIAIYSPGVFPQKIGSANSLVLFFPYALPEAIAHLQRYNELSPTVVKNLSTLHEFIAHSKTLSYAGFPSPLREFINDPRRNHDLCLGKLDGLFTTRVEHSWRMAFLLCGAFLAQRNDPKLLCNLLQRCLTMLGASWASHSFKQQIIAEVPAIVPLAAAFDIAALFSELLPFSGAFALPVNLLNKVVKEFFSTLEKGFVFAALPFFDVLEPQAEKAELQALYCDLLHSTLPSCLAKADAMAAISTIKALLHRLTGSIYVTPSHKLTLLYGIYKEVISAHDAVMEKLVFDALLPLLKGLPSTTLSSHKKIKKTLTEIAFAMMTGPFRKLYPGHNIAFISELFRLDLLQDDALEEFWNLILSHSPAPENSGSSLYRHRILSSAQQHGQWEKLSEQSRSTFQEYMKALHGKQFGEAAVEDKEETETPLNSDPCALFRKEICEKITHYHPEELQELLSLYQELIILSSEAIWLERDLLLSMIKAMAQSWNHTFQQEQELKGTVALLISKSSTQPFEELLEFLLACTDLAENATPIFLELAFELASGQDLLHALPDSFFKTFCSTLVSRHETSPSFKDLALLMAELQQSNLWEELLSLSLYVAAHNRSHATLVDSYAQWCCQRALEYGSPQDQDRAEKLLQLTFDNLSMVPENLSGLNLLCSTLIAHHKSSRNELQALFWLEKLLHLPQPVADTTYDEVFRLLESLATKRQLRSAYTLIDKLNNSEFEARWVALFELLLAAGDISGSLYLLQKKHEVMGIKKETSKRLWENKLESIISLIDDLASAKDKTTRRQRTALHELLHKLIWYCHPANTTIWKDYLAVLVDSGPLDLVEKTFLQLLDDNAISQAIKSKRIIQMKNPTWEVLPVHSVFWKGPDNVWKQVTLMPQQMGAALVDFCSFQDDEKRHWKISPTCWQALTERLAVEGSQLLFKVDAWWDKLQIELSTDCRFLNNKWLTCYLRGVAKAMPKTGISKKMQKQLIAICEKVCKSPLWGSFIGRLANLKMVCAMAKICLATQKLEFINEAIRLMAGSYLFMDQCAITQRTAAKVISKGLDIFLADWNNEKLAKSEFHALLRMNLDNYQSRDEDLFKMLAYFHRNERRPPPIHDYKKMTMEQALAKMNGLWLDHKKDLLKRIVSNSSYSEANPTPEEKALVIRAVRQLYYSCCTKYRDFLRWGLTQPGFTRYLDTETLRKIEKVQKRSSSHWLDKMRDQFAEDCDTATVAAQRFNVMLSYGYGNKFNLLPNEIAVYKRMDLRVLGVFILAFAVGLISIMVFRSVKN